MFLVRRLDLFERRRNVFFCIAPPTIDRSNLVEIYQVKFNQTARLECPMDGKPKPHIIWLINGRDMNINTSNY